jgi:hypothetical protein
MTDPTKTSHTPAVAAGGHKRKAYRSRRLLSRIVLEGRLALRRFQGDRLRPTVFVIGVQKAGTTSLFGHLAKHPEVVAPLVKEVHYFDVSYHRGPDWYEAHFEARDQSGRGDGPDPITFDTTPYYMFHPDVTERIFRYDPQAKIIAVLRDPVARAWSHYWHEWSRGFEKLEPMAAFEAEASRLPSPHTQVGGSPAARFAHQHYSYCARSEYDLQLERWLRVFGKDRLLCLKSETLFEQPVSTLSQVSDFLGIAPFPKGPDKILNSGRYNAPPPEVENWLRERLAPSMARTKALLGDVFDWD